jgi:hypothetical protein
MSAREMKRDWRWMRAFYAVQAFIKDGGHIPFKHYGEIFDLDEDETMELFDEVAVSMRVRITVLPDPTYH